MDIFQKGGREGRKDIRRGISSEGISELLKSKGLIFICISLAMDESEMENAI